MMGASMGASKQARKAAVEAKPLEVTTTTELSSCTSINALQCSLDALHGGAEHNCSALLEPLSSLEVASPAPALHSNIAFYCLPTKCNALDQDNRELH